MRLTKTWSGKQSHNGVLFFCVNAEKQVTEIVPDLSCRTHPLQLHWLPLPTPLHRGDILDLGDGTPAVLDFIGSWNKEELLANGLSPQLFEGEKKGSGYLSVRKGTRGRSPDGKIVFCSTPPATILPYRLEMGKFGTAPCNLPSGLFKRQ